MLLYRLSSGRTCPSLEETVFLKKKAGCAGRRLKYNIRAYNATEANWIPAGVRLVSRHFLCAGRKQIEFTGVFLQPPKGCPGFFQAGVDSAYLLYAAKALGAEVKAYYVKSQFQPDFELADALRLAAELEAEIQVIDCDIRRTRSSAETPRTVATTARTGFFPGYLRLRKKTATMWSWTAPTLLTTLTADRVCGLFEK